MGRCLCGSLAAQSDLTDIKTSSVPVDSFGPMFLFGWLIGFEFFNPVAQASLELSMALNSSTLSYSTL